MGKYPYARIVKGWLIEDLPDKWVQINEDNLEIFIDWGADLNKITKQDKKEIINSIVTNIKSIDTSWWWYPSSGEPEIFGKSILQTDNYGVEKIPFSNVEFHAKEVGGSKFNQDTYAIRRLDIWTTEFAKYITEEPIDTFVVTEYD